MKKTSIGSYAGSSDGGWTSGRMRKEKRTCGHRWEKMMEERSS